MKANINFKELEELINSRNYCLLLSELEEHNEVDIAQLIEILPSDKAISTFRILPKERAADVFSQLSSESQQSIINSIKDKELADIIEDLFVDDIVDMLEESPASVVKRILTNVQPDTRQLINQFLKYPKDSAGSIMTAEFTDLRNDMTVEEAIKHIRRTGEDRETIYYCYVINEQRVLEGVITVKSLLLSDDEKIVNDIMSTNVIKVVTTDDREDVAYLFSQYNLISIPVVDNENRLVGIVTVDDAVDVMEKEVTEDFEKMAGMVPSERSYLKTNVFTHAKKRIGWLLALMISSMITGNILGRYEAAFAALPLLVTFIPMLTDTGGNAGTQSSTLIIRGIALSEVRSSDFLNVLWKEIRIGALTGIILALVNYLRIIIMNPGSDIVALSVSIALFATVVIAKTIGGILPIIAKLLKFDPALMASPLITTIVDACSLLIYFWVATALLHL